MEKSSDKEKKKSSPIIGYIFLKNSLTSRKKKVITHFQVHFL